jgi:hypothetical protein
MLWRIMIRQIRQDWSRFSFVLYHLIYCVKENLHQQKEKSWFVTAHWLDVEKMILYSKKKNDHLLRKREEAGEE